MQGRLGCLLAAAFLLASFCPLAAWAEDIPDTARLEPVEEVSSPVGEQDAPDWAPSVLVSFDKESYTSADRIKVTAVGTNDGPATIRGIDLSANIPQGFSVVEGSATAHADELAPKGSMEASFVLVKNSSTAIPSETNPNANPPKGSSLVSTGDYVGWIPFVVIAAVALAVVVGVAVWRRRNKHHLLSVALACLLVASAIPFSADKSYADETDVANASLTVGHARATVQVDGRPIAFDASLAVTSCDDIPASLDAKISTSSVVAEGGSAAQIELSSDVPFSSEIPVDAVMLDEGFAACTVSSIERLGDSIVLRIEGSVGSTDEQGVVELSPEAFAGGETTGFGVVAIEPAAPYFGQASADAAGGDLFTLPIHLGSAEFVGSPNASNFSLPSDPSIKVVQVDAAARDSASLTFAPSGATGEARFEALDAALSAGGVAIEGSITNCGPLVACSNAATALEFVDATPTATARLDNMLERDDGTIAFDCVVDVAALNGSVALDQVTDVELRDGRNEGDDECALEDATPRLVDSDTLAFPVVFGSKGEEPLPDEGLMDALGDVDGDGSIGNAEQVLVEAMLEWTISGHDLVLRGDALTNAWGIAQNEVPVRLSIDDGSQAASIASPRNTEAAQTALEMVQDLLQAAGDFVSAATGDDKGGFVSGPGSILGFIAKAVGLSGESLISLEDIMKRLEGVNSELRNVDTKVSSLERQLTDVERRLEYTEDVRGLQDVLGRLSGYAPLVSTWTNKLDKADNDAKAFADLPAKDQAVLKDLAKSSSAFGSACGSSAFADTIRLGNLITGEGTINAKSVVSEYNEWLATYYNWAPETFEARSAFMTRVGAAYLMGYAASVCQLQVLIAETPKSEAAMLVGYETSLRELAKNAGNVVESLRGTKDASGKYVDSTLLAATKDRSDGKVLNLVTRSLFSQSGFSSNMYGPLASFTNKNIEKVRIYQFDGSLGRADFEEMQRRLPTVRARYPEIDSLWSELEKWGLQPKQVVQSKLAEKRYTTEVDQKDNANRFIVSNASRKKTKSKPSVQHTYTYYGDYFDISKGTVHFDQELYIADDGYYAGSARWYTACTLHNIMVAKAS